MVDLETGDYVTTQSSDTEYRKSILYLRNRDGTIATVYGIQLNYGDHKARNPFPVSITYKDDFRAKYKLSWPDERISLERLTSFLATWPALNQSFTRNFFVSEKAAQMGED
jgi:hypothetical protein